ncbi:hypothetical protein BaRGS_00039006 [Batillaria attramentaria]|uniref:Uncharacterized protein n=1 Tax=Batillaria attramentaria TaxID=370345 RepID=A0ABD0J460_9CAEN
MDKMAAVVFVVCFGFSLFASSHSAYSDQEADVKDYPWPSAGQAQFRWPDPVGHRNVFGGLTGCYCMGRPRCYCDRRGYRFGYGQRDLVH